MSTTIKFDDMASPRAKLFGRRLRALREAQGVSQALLYEKTGVTASYISLIERGKANPTLDCMASLCDALGEDVSNMLKLEEKN